jgi:hypothetical protein
MPYWRIPKSRINIHLLASHHHTHDKYYFLFHHCIQNLSSSTRDEFQGWRKQTTFERSGKDEVWKMWKIFLMVLKYFPLIRFFLYVRLFVVMGISWVIDILSWCFPHNNFFASLSIINCLQGFIIFMLFVWKSKVQKVLARK